MFRQDQLAWIHQSGQFWAKNTQGPDKFLKISGKGSKGAIRTKLADKSRIFGILPFSRPFYGDIFSHE